MILPALGAEPPAATIQADEAIAAEAGLKIYAETEARKTDNKFGVYVPASYKPTVPMPLLVNAHEPKGIAEWQKHADEIGFIVVGPTFLSNRGGELPVFHEHLLNDEKMLLKIMQRVFGSLAVDRKHVLFTGCSAGAFPTWYVAAKHPEIFTALCFRSGNFPGELEDLNDYMPKWVQRPIYLYWGEIDRPHVYAQNVEARKYLLEKVKLEKLKDEIIPGGGHTSRADLASKWFESLIRATDAPAK
jgi:poly(3-hydroxybutyrate) depolymerase